MFFLFSLQNLDDDEDAPRHVSENDGPDTQKDISLSVAEVKVIF